MDMTPEERELMRRIGRLGGKARAARMTPEERSEAARKAGRLGGRPRRTPPEAPSDPPEAA